MSVLLEKDGKSEPTFLGYNMLKQPVYNYKGGGRKIKESAELFRHKAGCGLKAGCGFGH